MKFKKYPNIRLKITLAFGLVFTLLSLILNLYGYQRIRALIINDDSRYLLSRAKSLLDKTEVSPVIIPLPEKNTEIKIYARQYDGKRVMLFHSPGVIEKIAIPHRQGVTDTLNLRIAYVVNSSDDNPAELMLAANGAQLQTTLRYLLSLLLLSTFASVLISGLVSYWLARFFLLPIQKIINTAKTINAGQLRDRVPVKDTNDELQELAKTINEMLQRIDLSLQQQRNFFAAASHELKTPLAILRAEVEVNLRKPGLADDFKKLLDSQLEEINRLQNVVQEFLVISQIKEDKLVLQKEPVDLSELVLKAVKQIKPLAIKINVTIEVAFDKESGDFYVSGDKEKLRILLINLLENAIKYCVTDDKVLCFMSRSRESDEIAVNIENPIRQQKVGVGSLTDAFYRGDILQPGFGIGLWLCHEITVAHNGRLILESENYRFKCHVSLPV